MHHDEIRVNAQTGNGACSECPAYHKTVGEFVNPGLGDPEGDVVFVTDEPRHRTDWTVYESWAEYNAEWFDRFKEARGGNSSVDCSRRRIVLSTTCGSPIRLNARRRVMSDERYRQSIPMSRSTIAAPTSYRSSIVSAHRRS
jgi:hypothetical protein